MLEFPINSMCKREESHIIGLCQTSKEPQRQPRLQISTSLETKLRFTQEDISNLQSSKMTLMNATLSKIWRDSGSRHSIFCVKLVYMSLGLAGEHTTMLSDSQYTTPGLQIR